MGRADYLAEGDFNAQCYECGKKFKASMLKKHWQGYYVCPEHWEARQPQDFVRTIPDLQAPPWAQPLPANVFLPTDYTPSVSDLFYIDDLIAKDVTKVISNVMTYGPDAGTPLGGCVLAGETLAGGGNPIGPSNEIYLTDSISVSMTTNLTASDTLTLTESVTYFFYKPNALAMQALATSTLG